MRDREILAELKKEIHFLKQRVHVLEQTPRRDQTPVNDVYPRWICIDGLNREDRMKLANEYKNYPGPVWLYSEKGDRQ